MMFSKNAASLHGNQRNFHQACRDAVSGFLPVHPCHSEGGQCHRRELRHVHEAKPALWYVSETRMMNFLLPIRLCELEEHIKVCMHCLGAVP